MKYSEMYKILQLKISKYCCDMSDCKECIFKSKINEACAAFELLGNIPGEMDFNKLAEQVEKIYAAFDKDDNFKVSELCNKCSHVPVCDLKHKYSINMEKCKDLYTKMASTFKLDICFYLENAPFLKCIHFNNKID